MIHVSILKDRLVKDESTLAVRRVMTTSDPDAFNFRFSQLIQQDNFRNASVKTMEAIDAVSFFFK